MRTSRRTWGRVWMILVAAVGAAAATAFAADANVTGTWTMNVETSAGGGTPVFTLMQSGKEVTGDYKGLLGEAPVTGTVNGNEVKLEYTISGQGMEITVTYTGTVEGDTMKGKVSLGELGEGTFTGTRG